MDKKRRTSTPHSPSSPSSLISLRAEEEGRGSWPNAGAPSFAAQLQECCRAHPGLGEVKSCTYQRPEAGCVLLLLLRFLWQL